MTASRWRRRDDTRILIPADTLNVVAPAGTSCSGAARGNVHQRGWSMAQSEMEARWRSGEPMQGIAFARGAHVRIMEGPFADECAYVRDVVGLEPEPCYRVEVDAAHVEMELTESALGAP
jgi:hypothetical protein